MTTITPPVVVPTGNNIILNPLQRGNPVLECIRNVGKEFGDIVADFQVGRTAGVLFLSLRYHRLHPEYIHTRIDNLGQSYNLRILLILCDITEHRDPIRELTKMSLINNMTVVVAFSNDEAGHYLATFKQFEHKPPTMIKERPDTDYPSLLRSSLTSISKVNKTDAETLRAAFGSFSGISKATSDQLQNLPGFGQIKVRNLKNAFEKPFRNNATTSLALLASQAGSDKDEEQSTDAHVDKGKARATEDDSSPPHRPPREPSPVWDIELNSPEPPVTRPPRPESPVWDIELDLN